MQKIHELIARRPFDLHQLHLFRLVAELGNFTRGAQAARLTQSAMTRQIQGMENQLGLELFRRTTRAVALTEAGRFLLRESQSLLGEADVLLRRLREDYAEAPREVRVGISRSVMTALESDALDVGVLMPPGRLSSRLRITHRFSDQFTLIAHADRVAAAGPQVLKSRKALGPWLESQPWLALQDSTQTGRRLAAWLKRQKLQVKPAMELDNFDLIITLVALGVGVSIVPQRSLALYARRQSLVRLPWPTRFVRELVVVVRRERKTPEHIRRFVENILF